MKISKNVNNYPVLLTGAKVKKDGSFSFSFMPDSVLGEIFFRAW